MSPVDRWWLSAFRCAPRYSLSLRGTTALNRLLVYHRHLTFMGFLRAAPDFWVQGWGLQSRWQLPGAALRRVARVRWRA
jgi:hypothetical protein